MNESEKIRVIADHYGYDSQSRQCIEEMADVQVTLLQMAYLLKIDIQSMVNIKLDRQFERIKRE